jgi:MFS transporter, ACS family, hexuronate transporter
MSGASIGAIVAGPLVATITHFWSWRSAFVITGSFGFVWLVGWLLLYRAPATNPFLYPAERILLPSSEFSGDERNGVRWIDLLRYRQVWALLIGRMLEAPVFWMYLFWLPQYMVKYRGIPLLHMGWILTIPYVALDLGQVGGGWVASRLLRREWSVWKTKSMILTVSACFMLVTIPAGLSTGTLFFVICVSLVMLGHGAWNSSMITIPTDISPRGLVATVCGITAVGAGLGGMVFTDLTGFIADKYHSFVPVFAAGAFLPLLGTAIILGLCKGRIGVDESAVLPHTK